MRVKPQEAFAYIYQTDSYHYKSHLIGKLSTIHFKH